MEVNRENMCIIFLDSGVIDDHLPNNVLDSLKKVKVQCMNIPNMYKKDEIQAIRKQQAKLRSGIRKGKVNSSLDTGNRYIFMDTGLQTLTEVDHEVDSAISSQKKRLSGPTEGHAPDGNRHSRAAGLRLDLNSHGKERRASDLRLPGDNPSETAM